MSLPNSLLKVAEELLTPTGPGRPDQGRLRRSVSTSYYAAFHRLVESSVDRIAGRSAAAPLRSVIARAYEHGSMKDLCNLIQRGNVPKGLAGMIKTVPEDLVRVAQEFSNLQEHRHNADYNLAVPIALAHARRCVESARRIFEALEPESATQELKDLLTVLPMWGQVKKRT
jgi:uncharacterized protein (UPF0332 family)